MSSIAFHGTLLTVKSQRINVFLDPEVVKSAKAKAAYRGITLSKFIEEQLSSILFPKHISDKEVIEKMDKMFEEYQQWKKDRIIKDKK